MRNRLLRNWISGENATRWVELGRTRHHERKTRGIERERESRHIQTQIQIRLHDPPSLHLPTLQPHDNREWKPTEPTEPTERAQWGGRGSIMRLARMMIGERLIRCD